MQFNPAFAVLTTLFLAAAAPVAAAQTDDPCTRAVKAQSTGGADYKPGVDVYGRPVAPADTQPTLRIDPPQVIEFPVTLDVAKRLGFDTRGPYEAKTTLTNVRIENGRVTVNGQVIHTTNEADLIAACRAARR